MDKLIKNKGVDYFYNKVPVSLRSEFIRRFEYICNYLQIEPIWLLKVINKETGGTFSPSIKNPHSSASGLIQFMADTAISLGTTTQKLRLMDHVQQLEYVQKYFEPYKGKMKSFEDVYFAVFLPMLIGKPLTWVVPQKYYKSNKGIDLNKDGVITKQEFINWANK